ncbi:golgin family A protein [Perilla frutescens var. hirtella]|nr:golgin family A protein [Perilla frutescens var. hirtella]KAH6806148.1 golgin family A protein [Perilla frutescens var. frutescens]
MMEGLNVPTKIRKRRGYSSSPSSSSRIYNYRFSKRAILVGKNRAGLRVGLGRSRSSTPVPTWRTTPLRSAIETPKYSQSGKSARPVSARRLAATLWEMNEMPSPKLSESNLEVMRRQQKKSGSRMVLKGEKLMQSGWGLHSGSGSLPPHLSDPPHSPTVSEKMDRSGTGSRHRRTPSISQKLMSADRNTGAIDSISNASFMEIETRSRPQISSESVVGGKNRLKDVSSALTTSKELLKIINRIWAQADQPSSSMSLISALHAELERARLQVNQLIHEQRSEKNEINYLMKCFAEEKASWKNTEQLAVEAAIGSIARELEVERKLRRRLESLNTKLGKELAEIKSSFMKAVKELETEKRAREITEQVCDELARNIDEDRAEVEKLKRESVRINEDVEKEREMLDLADKLHEERAHMKLSEAKHQFEEKNFAIGKLRKQLEVFLGTKRDKDEERAIYSSKHNIMSHQHEGEDDEEVEDGIDSKEDSAESDLHSIELDLNNKSNNDKGHKWTNTPVVDRESRRLPVNNETKARNSISGLVSRRSTSLQRSASDGVEWAAQGAGNQHIIDGLGEEGFHEVEKEALRSSYLNEIQQRLKSTKGLKNHLLSSSRLGRETHSPSPKKEQSSWPPRDPCAALHERSSLSKPRTSEGSRRSKW